MYLHEKAKGIKEAEEVSCVKIDLHTKVYTQISTSSHLDISIQATESPHP